MVTKSNQEVAKGHREQDANELIELLTSSRPAERANEIEGNDFLLTTDILLRLAEQYRRKSHAPMAVTSSVAPPPPRRNALATTVALAIAVCALGLVVLQTLDAPSAAAAELDHPVAPTSSAAESTAAPAPTEPTPIAAAPSTPIVEDEFTLADVESFDAARGDDGSSSRRNEMSVEPQEAEASDAVIEDNPYDSPSAPAPATTPAAAAAPAPAATPKNEVEDLIESALSRPVKTREVSAEATNLLPHETFNRVPEAPSRAQVRQVMNGLLSEIRSCGGETYDRLVVRLTVVGETGRVTAARTIDSNYAGTAVGTCAARVARMAKFPRFAKNELVVKYPFEL